MAAKQGLPSSMPSAFLEDELFEEPFSMEEIESDPAKHILWAAENNKLDIVENLLTSDTTLINSKDEDQYTPLHRASYNGHTEMMEALLTNGADINAKTVDGWQPFHSACRWDNVESAKLLLQQGADPHCLTNGNNSALHLAAINGEAEAMITYLLSETDIDPSTKNAAGDTAEDVARRNSPYAKHLHTAQKKGGVTNKSNAECEVSSATGLSGRVCARVCLCENVIVVICSEIFVVVQPCIPPPLSKD